jgi:GNAT superfamily N-acetyltransferase
LSAAVTIAEADPDADEARACLAAYYALLAERIAGGFDPAAGTPPDPAGMRPPLGAFLVARGPAGPAGCVALTTLGPATGEIKRLWVAPAARGLGLGRRLMDAAETRARNLGMTLLRLDTNDALTEAITLYRSTGWTETPPYNDNPYARLWFMKPVAGAGQSIGT